MTGETARRPYDSGRRQEAARRSRAAILAAGRELLLRDGYRATTVRAVAERAGVSPETLYKAFGGKPGLVKALWDVTLAGDDEPLAMAQRPQLKAVLAARDTHAKLRLYAAFVRGVHERLADLAALLAQAGPDGSQILTLSEEERMTGVSAFVTHLTDTGVLPADADAARLADSWWALTGPHLYTQLTAGRGWNTDAYEDWLTGMLLSGLAHTT
ncbi:TetR/AcrR family transcriptional regulator [Kitasatospora sp. NA04385]|uniref:TetR/AcrR family transcriptional regulator n=1 Tax=Kitasatospora sp. NA04385 TaxID=2742135 RepID=UPI00159183AB|nr:TetR/AcrR family transcriptional regulator [Kitasatospora sp. NA04385]QKW20114.1 TetR/AcrR family transcriptional regulator [Kitasatospora sp. NA04385]